MYINIWHDLGDKTDMVFEQSISQTIEEAIKQYKEEDEYGCIYEHTLKIEGDKVEKIYLGEHMKEEPEEDDSPYAERTVEENHEHKTLCAKFLNRG